MPDVVICYRSPAGYTCFQQKAAARDGMLCSCRGPEPGIAAWPDEAAAVAWLAARGLRPGDTVPVGVGWMVAEVGPLDPADLDPARCRGALFGVPHAAALPPLPPPRPEDFPTVEIQGVQARLPKRGAQLSLFGD